MGLTRPDIDLAELKRALRREMSERRGRLSAADRHACHRAATSRLLALPELASAAGRTIGGYVALAGKGEMDPADSLAELATRGAHLALPRVLASAGAAAAVASPGVGATAARLRFHRWEPGADLVAGPFGLLEPPASAPEVRVDELAVVIVPGVAFDGEGRRVGFGRGYYDGALGDESERARPVAVGLAYDFQVIDRCPEEPWDVRVDLVVTDQRVIRPAGAGRGGGVGKVQT